MRNLAVLLLPLAIACTPAQTTTTDSPAPETAMAAPVWRTGNYRATLQASDFPSAPEQMRTQVAGAWEVQFHEGNHFVAMQNGRQVVQGPYQISGNRIMFSSGETGPFACNTNATYTWQTNNGQTTFTRVNDDCAGRVLALTSRPFTFAP
jgi:hypothetical protein